MLINPELAKKMIEQVRNEFAASLQYLAIAIYFEQEAMDNTAAFFYAQAEEENEHGMMLLRYVVETPMLLESSMMEIRSLAVLKYPSSAIRS